MNSINYGYLMSEFNKISNHIESIDSLSWDFEIHSDERNLTCDDMYNLIDEVKAMTGYLYLIAISAAITGMKIKGSL